MKDNQKIKVEVKNNFTSTDQILFEAGLTIFYEETENKVKEYIV